MKWTIEELKRELSGRPNVKGWIITEEHTHRRERYFMKGQGADSSVLAVDQDREVKGQTLTARIFVKLPREGRQGEISKKLFPSVGLKEQIDTAIEAALQTDHQSWELPTEIPAKVPERKTSDPRIAEDIESVVAELTGQIAASVGQSRKTEFNSAELFLSSHDRTLHLSNGLINRSSQSRIYAEAAYSITRAGKDGVPESDEYLNTAWSVSLDDLSIPSLFDETSARAEVSLDVVKPKTGKYPVIVDAEVLATLFNGHVGQLSAFNSYSKLPFVKPGEPLIPGAKGDLLTVTLDPALDFGADTTAVSDQGVVQNRLEIVKDNIVVATATDKQYSDYLGIPITTARGNVVLNTGTLSHRELTQAAPVVIEILQFSGLFADSNSGTFSSEIRLAKLYDNVKGTVTYLKGGSLSGSVTENFKGARLSRERVKRANFSSFSASAAAGQGYSGPAHALLSDVSVVG